MKYKIGDVVEYLGHIYQIFGVKNYELVNHFSTIEDDYGTYTKTEAEYDLASVMHERHKTI